MTTDRRIKNRADSLNLLDYQIVDAQGRTGEYAMGRTLNISEGGMLLETHIPLELDQLVLVTLDLEEQLLQVTGKVVHTCSSEEERHRAGVQFFHVEEHDRQAINHYIKMFNERKLSPEDESVA